MLICKNKKGVGIFDFCILQITILGPKIGFKSCAIKWNWEIDLFFNNKQGNTKVRKLDFSSNITQVKIYECFKK